MQVLVTVLDALAWLSRSNFGPGDRLLSRTQVHGTFPLPNTGRSFHEHSTETAILRAG
jgi:hypothetical protein